MNRLARERLQHSFLAKSFHWLFVFVFGYGVFKQIQSKDQLNDIELLKSEMIFAVIFLTLLITRFLYMKRTFKTSLPSKTSKIHRSVAKLVHTTMYIVLSGVAISGLGIGFLFWLGFHNSVLIEITIWAHELLFRLQFNTLHVLAQYTIGFKMILFGAPWYPFLRKKIN